MSVSCGSYNGQVVMWVPKWVDMFESTATCGSNMFEWVVRWGAIPSYSRARGTIKIRQMVRPPFDS